jgi:hypothetical protein
MRRLLIRHPLLCPIERSLRQRRCWLSIQNGIDIVERGHAHIGPAFDGCCADVWEQKGVLETNIARVEFWLSFVHVTSGCRDVAALKRRNEVALRK